MKKKTKASPASQATYPVLPVLVILVLVVLVLSRLYYLPIAFDRDEGSYLYFGKLILHGELPYQDFYEIKPPGIFYSYALIAALFGTSPIGAHVALLAIKLASGYLLFRISRRYADSSFAWLAILAYGLYSTNPYLQDLAMVSEHLTTLCTLGGIWMLHQALDKKKNFWWIGSGIILAWSVLIKQTGLFYFLPAIVIAIGETKAQRQPMPWKGLIFLLGASISTGLVMLLLLWMQGSLPEAYHWLVERPLNYAEVIGDDQKTDLRSHFISLASKTLWMLGIVSAVGMILAWIDKPRRYPIYVLTLTLAAGINLIIGGRYYGHYALNLLPFLAMWAAYAWYVVGNRIPFMQLQRSWLYILLCVPVIGITFFLARAQYFPLDRTIMVRRIYGLNPFDEMYHLGKYINGIKGPDDEVLVVGSEPEGYLYTHSVAPTRHVFPAFISDAEPENVRYQQEASEAMKSSKPKYLFLVVSSFSWLFKDENQSGRSYFNNAFYFVQQGYRRVAIAETYPDRPSRYFYGDEATNRDAQSSTYIEVYERR
ncbi:MAG: glycosyltransferase family 39 protein [Saprospiraceae bacterium]|nr:glycosyltransferase family 39 protein [Saprospiraceae bacterium]MCB9318065.1 glycosyltransferase family 39 protein [Lewinellaceae bacterium]